MSIPEFFIKRPVMTTLVTVAITAFGLMAYRSLPVNDLPNVDFPTITVSASLPGANPETMASSVARPLEQQFSTIAGIDSMSSSSNTGSTSITLQFALDRSIDGAAQDVQAAISAVARRLPQDMPSPPSFKKVNAAEDGVFNLSVNSPTLSLSQVNEYADTLVAQRLSMVEGVAQVTVSGGQKYAVRAQLDPRALAARGIGLEEVRTALNTGNVNLPTGTLNGSTQAMTVQASGQMQTADAYRGHIVAYRNGSPVRLGDLGQVADSVENIRTAGWFNNARSILLQVQRQPGANTIEAVDRVKALLPAIRAQLPDSINLEIVSDKTEPIRESVADVKFTLILAIILVVLVIFLFLRNIPATIIPGISMPIAVVGTFAVMYFCGFSIDNLSLLALTLSVGFVVDDAIVMLENIVRHIEMGKSVMEASMVGSREIGFTIMSMTLSLVAVFIPVLFMEGILGRLLHEFAITISASILVSGFVSITLTPMLCSRFLKPIKHDQKHGGFYNAIERSFQWTSDLYERTLKISLRHRFTVLVIAFAMVGLTGWLLVIVPKGFIPTDDQGIVRANMEAAEDISFDAMVKHERAVAAIVFKNPAVESFSMFTGDTFNKGRLTMHLVPRDKRPSADVVAQQLRTATAAVPGIRTVFSVPPSINLGGRRSAALYQFTLYGTNLEELYSTAPEFMQKVRGITGLQDVTSDLQIKNPQIFVDIDRDKAGTLGITAQQIEDTLYNAFGSRQVSTIYTAANQYQVILELAEVYQRDVDALSMLYVRSPLTGKLVPMESVAKLRRKIGPLSVSHLGQLPSVTISFNLAPGYSLGEATARIQQLAKTELPSTMGTTFEGAAAAFSASLKGLGLLLIVAVLVIYIVLGILYEDFIHPITILSGLPSASFGALLTLICFRQELNIYGYVGMIMLIGIVKKNAIMMIDFALEERKKNVGAEKAIYDACIVRFRPIMMTTLAALAGTAPIAIGLGAGAESRRSLGLAVVGGLLVSQLLTLYITPVFYIYLEQLTVRLKKKGKEPAGELHHEPIHAK
jgi:HAE1 family hydrophobic/amphiphilic exporter-1